MKKLGFVNLLVVGTYLDSQSSYLNPIFSVHLYWPDLDIDLDIDLEIESIEHPDRFPLVG